MNWIKVTDKKPLFHEDILFTNGKKIYLGWVDTYEPEEDLVFVVVCDDSVEYLYEEVTHWMKLPKLPRMKDE